YRGKNAEATLLSWESVRNGEEKNIFPYQEEADIMFNSTLVYEMCILKKFAQPLLKEIPADSPAYLEANRLLSFLNYFIDVKDDVVNNVIPNNSILKEFIGGSCFR
ncbi:MAG TPA: AAA family ATPase, partial [Clostridiaceae bacterium]|nr:AAA family ATPase [Clostridiaceae bacterium]